jgi:hypothetical protein
LIPHLTGFNIPRDASVMRLLRLRPRRDTLAEYFDCAARSRRRDPLDGSMLVAVAFDKADLLTGTAVRQ